MKQPVLTVIIPAYNESATVCEVLEAVAAASYDKEIILVDDGSSDGTGAAVARWLAGNRVPVDVVRHPANRGKGSAIRTGLARARGRIVIVQDADLECHPSDYPALVEPILSGRAQVVFGSRFLCPEGRLPWSMNRACVVLLNVLVHLLYGRKLTDEATCYKVLRTELLQSLDLQCERFEFCPELTAKICRLGLAIHEVPIRYTPRLARDGKKIRWWDGLEAIATLLWWRVAPFRCKSLDGRDASPPTRIVEVETQ